MIKSRRLLSTLPDYLKTGNNSTKTNQLSNNVQSRIHWYPGHMEKSLKQIRERVIDEQIGLVLEVRDSRAPLSCVNWKFEQIFNHGDNSDRSAVSKDKKIFRNEWGDSVGQSLGSSVQRVIVYNKSDLVDGPVCLSGNRVQSLFLPRREDGNETVSDRDQSHSNWRQMLCDNSRYPSIFTSCTSKSGIEELLEYAVKYWVRYHYPSLKSTPSVPYPPLNIMVIGLPNTGKSSLINTLRTSGLVAESASSCAAVGRNPGHTKHISSKYKVIDTQTSALSTTSTSRVNELLDDLKTKSKYEPEAVKFLRKHGVRLKVYVMDCPGILPPYIPDQHTSLKLALIHSFPNELGQTRGANSGYVAEYLWWRMRERWGIAGPFMQSLGMDISAGIPERVDPILRHIHSQRQPEPSDVEVPSNASDMQVAAFRFLRMWRDGEIYRNLGLFIRPNDNNTSPRTRMNPQQRRMLTDLWKVTMVDDEFLDGYEHVKKWHDERFNHDKSMMTSSNKVKVGDMVVNWEETVSAQERKKRSKATTKS